MTHSYRIEFRPRAARAYRKLDTVIQRQIAKKLDERRLNPKVLGDRLRNLPRCYKIKLRSSGYRFAYRVNDDVLIVLVLAIDKREGDEAYLLAADELQSLR